MNAHPNMDAHKSTAQKRELPTVIEAEQALLGAVMMNNESLSVATAKGLEPADFSEQLHGEIFATMLNLADRQRSINPVTLISQLDRSMKVGEITISQYLASIVASAVNVINVPDYTQAIISSACRRQLISLSDLMSETGYNIGDDFAIADNIAQIEDELDFLKDQLAEKATHTNAGTDYLSDFDAAAKQDVIPGVKIALPEIAYVLSEKHFEKGNLYGLLSSSGEGKTSLVLQLITGALEDGNPVLFLSYDQSASQCVRQMIAQKHGIDVSRQREPHKLNDQEQNDCVSFAHWINDQLFEIKKCQHENATGLERYVKQFVRRMKAKAARQNREWKVPLVVVDHIGKVAVKDPRADAGRQAGQINMVFKAAAEAHGCTFFVLNQRSTGSVKRDNPHPISTDIYGGEGARADYDAFLYLYRAEKYKAERLQMYRNNAREIEKLNGIFGAAPEGKAKIGALKCRFSSPNITRIVEWDAKFTRYVSRIDDAQKGMF